MRNGLWNNPVGVTRAEIWSKLIESPFFISYQAFDIEQINSHKKNQYTRTGFFYTFFSKINRLRGEQKYVIMAAARKNLPLR